jgi:ATP-dependent protease ClpP protease subunit
MKREKVAILKEEDSAKKSLLVPAPQISFDINLGANVDRRVVHLAGELEEGDEERFMMLMEHLWSTIHPKLYGVPGETVEYDKRAITVYLNTPGGDVTVMFAIHDIIRMSPVPVHIIGYGQVVSSGVLILACGHRRYVTESCVLMSHEPTVGDGEELGMRAAKDRRKWEDWMHVYWCELMGRYTPDMDAAWWKRKTERQGEYWRLGAQEIVEVGLADEIVPDAYEAIKRESECDG